MTLCLHRRTSCLRNRTAYWEGLRRILFASTAMSHPRPSVSRSIAGALVVCEIDTGMHVLRLSVWLFGPDIYLSTSLRPPNAVHAFASQ